MFNSSRLLSFVFIKKLMYSDAFVRLIYLFCMCSLKLLRRLPLYTLARHMSSSLLLLCWLRYVSAFSILGEIYFRTAGLSVQPRYICAFVSRDNASSGLLF